MRGTGFLFMFVNPNKVEVIYDILVICITHLPQELHP